MTARELAGAPAGELAARAREIRAAAFGTTVTYAPGDEPPSAGDLADAAELRRLRAAAPAISVPAGALGTIRLAGELALPVTVTIGAGEERAARLEALEAIAALGREHGHVQAVALDATGPDDERAWTTAAARIVLPAPVHVTAPFLDAGADDLGAVTAAVEELRALADARGLTLVPRLALHPEYVRDLDRWADPALAPAVRRAADASGLAREDAWSPGETGPIPAGFRTMFSRAHARTRARDPRVRTALATAAAGEELAEEQATALLRARGEDRAAVFAAADALRAEVCGDDVSYVVTRNIQYTNVCYFRCGFCAFSKGRLAADLRGKPYLVPLDEVVRRAREAWERGAVEVCLQGGIHPGFDGDFYASVVEAIRDAVPGLHVHAFSALEIWQGAATLGVPLEDYLRRLRALGLSSLPGTAAEILDDDVRALICPDKIDTSQWLEVHDAAHRAGLRSNVTMMFGHVERPEHWARHMIRAREQQRRSGGFTEFVPLPFVHMEAPMWRRGLARSGPTFGETLLVHAVARLVLHPFITNIQASWVKLGPEGVRAVLRSGVNDLGGTLMNESISRVAGAGPGQEMPPARLEQLIRSAGRAPRQRTTLYGTPDREQVRRSFGAAALEEPSNPPAAEAGLRPRRHLVRAG